MAEWVSPQPQPASRDLRGPPKSTRTRPALVTQAIKQAANIIMNTQPVGLGIFVEQGTGSETRAAWLPTGNQPDAMPETPHLAQPPTFGGPPPNFALAPCFASAGFPGTLRPASSNDTSQQMRRGGQRALVGLGLMSLDDATKMAFADMRTAESSIGSS